MLATLVASALAVALGLLAVMAAGAPVAGGQGVAGGDRGTFLTVRDADDDLLARVPLAERRFAVRYRNSLYGTLAEERYRVGADGRFRLVELAADQLAVLEEYYAVPGAPWRGDSRDRRDWIAEPDPQRPAAFSRLSIAATDLGRRTILVPGHPPLPLWRLVSDNPTVVLQIEETQ